MAKKSAVNKSQAIRDALESNPDKSPAEIAELLKADGLNVTAQYVSTIKSNAKVKARRKVVARRGRPAKAISSVAAAATTLGTMDAAVALIQAAGGIEQARAAIDTIEQISVALR